MKRVIVGVFWRSCLILSGVLVMLFGCYLAISGMNDSYSVALDFIFLVGLAFIIVGFIRIIRWGMGKEDA